VDGVGGSDPRAVPNKEALCRRIVLVDCGSVCGAFLIVRGDTDGDFELPVILRANLRNGEIERERDILAAVVAFDDRDPLVALVGVARYPFFVEVPEVLESWSLKPASPLKKYLRVLSISVSVREIRSRRLFHRCADSACLRRVSPFFVTRSRTPLSIIERTLDVAGM
jgi:hypothetical protein